MKKAIIGSILVLAVAAGFAYAHGNGWGHMRGGGGHMMGYNGGGHMMGNGGYGMMGPGMMNYGGYGNCPGAAYFGKDGWNSEGHQKYLEDTAGLRKELNDKRFDYFEALRNPNADKEKLASLEKEMLDIERQLQDKALQY